MSAFIFRSVHDAAEEAGRMLHENEALSEVWRHAVIQLLDDYRSTARHHGVPTAARLFADPPPETGEPRVDAAFAALAEHLARRDGWTAPQWSQTEQRVTDKWWFVTDLTGLHPRALVESPVSFRKRGVFITDGALERV